MQWTALGLTTDQMVEPYQRNLWGCSLVIQLLGQVTKPAWAHWLRVVTPALSTCVEVLCTSYSNTYPPSILPVMHQTRSCIYMHSMPDPFLAKEKTLLGSAKVCPQSIYAVRTGIWTMKACWVIDLNIPTLPQRRLHLKASIMYQFLRGDSYIPEDVLLLHPPSN